MKNNFVFLLLLNQFCTCRILDAEYKKISYDLRCGSYVLLSSEINSKEIDKIVISELNEVNNSCALQIVN